MRVSSPRQDRNARAAEAFLQFDVPKLVRAAPSAIALQKRIIDRLHSEAAPDLAKPLEECGRGFELTCTNCGGVHETVTRCKKRWCPVCARIVSARRLDKYQAVIEQMRSPIFVTLTMQHSADTSSPEDVRKLRRAIGKLRKRKWFAEKVAGGICSIEVTCGANGWHPHAHMLLESRWFSVTTPAPDRSYTRSEIKEMCAASSREVQWQWESCLGGVGGVKISRARPQVAREVLKYAVKPTELADSQFPLAPLLRVLAVSRLISTWGTVRKAYAHMRSLEQEKNFSLQCPCGVEPSWIPSEILRSMSKEDREKRVYEFWVSQARNTDHARARRECADYEAQIRIAIKNPGDVPFGRLGRRGRSRVRATA
jgi:hypothetical protein